VERHVVLGTAGHIDHGKTALVKVLTGVDTDRLAEEKRRGITIDLGFAPLALGDIAASVVDVPGHEGFIRNMVAGATGVDLALLVVAADEGVMPQTTEHLEILRLLGVARGVVALTKCDLAREAAWRELVADEIRDRLRAAFGEPWPVVETSAVEGTGLDALRAALEGAARSVLARPTDDRFRLPVDRVFALPGAGTIVTGTLWSGTAAEGDRLTLMPAGLEARVRSIEVHDRPASRAEPGRRTALALVGPSREQVARGDVLVSGDGWRASRAMDVALTMLPEAESRLRPRLRVRIHHGTAEVLARIVPSPAAGAAGGRIAARLLLETPLVARAGDRFVVRSYSPVTTIGGGVVVDPWAEDLVGARRRGAGAGAWAGGGASADLPATDADLVAWLVRRRGPTGLARAALEVAAGMDRTRLGTAVAAALAGGLVETDGWLVAAGEVEALADRLAETLARFHDQHPLEPGMPSQSWRSAAGAAPQALVDLGVQRLVAARLVVKDGALVRRGDWAPRLGTGAMRLREELLAALREADAEPPSVAELAARHPKADVAGLLRLMAREGLVVAVGKDRYYEAAALNRERDRLVALLEELGSASPAAVRDRIGRSRKWLIPFLEWCDAQGITARRGDERVLANPRPA
jgi:selenocysteine-specific elongation factor